MAVVVAVAVWLSGCASTTAPTPPASEPAPTVTAITIGGLIDTATTGQVAQLSATATLSDSTTQTVTEQATWQTSNASVVTVTAAGLATFVGAGQADVTATYSNVTGTAHATVSVQTIPRHTLTGAVTDGNGAAVSGARVVVLDGVNAGRATQTDAAGNYSLTDLTEGLFTIEVTNPSYQTARRAVTLKSDVRADVTLVLVVDFSAFYGTYNISLTVNHQSCEFPVTPDPTGQLVLNGNADGSGFTATVKERGTSRIYRGTIRGDGNFRGSGSGVIPGSADRPMPQQLTSKPMHEYTTGDIRGTVSGASVSGKEVLTFGAPCPGRIIDIGFSGSK